MLRKMYDGEYLLTKSNYKQYLEKEMNFYTTFDYKSLIVQKDYECDFFADALLGEKITEAEAVNSFSLSNDAMELSKAEIVEDAETEKLVLKCVGTLDEGKR